METMIARLLSAYCIVLAGAVGVHFVVTETELYAAVTKGYPLWAVFDWFMAPAILIALVASLVWKLEMGRGEAGESGLVSYIEINVLFYAALALTLLFFSNWFASLMDAPIERSLVWVAVDTATVAVVGAVGFRLWPHPDKA